MSSNPSLKPLLIKFDLGLLKRIDLEVAATEDERSAEARAAGRTPPREIARTEMIRDLIMEALDLRCRNRNQAPPYVIPVLESELASDVEDSRCVRRNEGIPYVVAGDELEPETIFDASKAAAPILAEVGPKHEPIVIETFEEFENLYGKVEGEPTSVAQVSGAQKHQDWLIKELEEVAADGFGEFTGGDSKPYPLSEKPSDVPMLPGVSTSLASLDRGPAPMGVALVSGQNKCGACSAGRHDDCSAWCFCDHSASVMRDGSRAEVAAAISKLEGTTVGVEAEGASVEGDACEVRSGGNSESTAVVGESLASLDAKDLVEVPEVGTAGGRGWLGDSIRPIGVSAPN